MRIAIFGGTGSLGWLIVRRAVEEEYGCKVLTRRADRMPEVPGVEFVQGDARNGGKVMLTLTGCDAAIVCLRPEKKEEKGLLPQATSLVTAGMKKLEMKRLLLVSALGAGESVRNMSLPAKLMNAALRGSRLREKEEQEQIVRESGLDWTIVRPAPFTEGAATGRYTADEKGVVKAKKLTREDAADFIVRELAEAEYAGSAVVLSGA